MPALARRHARRQQLLLWRRRPHGYGRAREGAPPGSSDEALYGPDRLAAADEKAELALRGVAPARERIWWCPRRRRVGRCAGTPGGDLARQAVATSRIFLHRARHARRAAAAAAARGVALADAMATAAPPRRSPRRRLPTTLHASPSCSISTGTRGRRASRRTSCCGASQARASSDERAGAIAPSAAASSDWLAGLMTRRRAAADLVVEHRRDARRRGDAGCSTARTRRQRAR
jgi:hypothetical protein